MPISAISLKKTHIKITGPDAKKFLQGQLTCDINEIDDKQSRPAAHCNPKGRMMSLGRVYQYQNEIYFSVPQSIAKSALAYLKHYAKFSKVSLSENELSSIAVIGESAKAFLETKPNENILIIEHSDRLELIGPGETLNQLVQKHHIALTEDSTPWELADIKEGIAFLCPETQEQFLPHDIHLPQLQGVSFNKGCYIGQEIIARMQFLGKLKTALALVEIFSEQSHPGQNILDENQKPQAEIICQAQEKPGQYLALAKFNQAPPDKAYLENQDLVTVKKLF